MYGCVRIYLAMHISYTLLYSQPYVRRYGIVGGCWCCKPMQIETVQGLGETERLEVGVRVRVRGRNESTKGLRSDLYYLWCLQHQESTGIIGLQVIYRNSFKNVIWYRLASYRIYIIILVYNSPVEGVLSLARGVALFAGEGGPCISEVLFREESELDTLFILPSSEVLPGGTCCCSTGGTAPRPAADKEESCSHACDIFIIIIAMLE